MLPSFLSLELSQELGTKSRQYNKGYSYPSHHLEDSKGFRGSDAGLM